MMGIIAAIILAAGESKRMGYPKMLLTFNGRTMLENVIRNVTASDVDNTLVVLGGGPGSLMDIVNSTSAKYCYNGNYKDGMLSSVQCGFRNLPSEIDAVMVFQGDQPFISPGLINEVIVSYLSAEKGIVIPLFKGKRGHPILIDKKYRNEIDKLDSNEGLRSLSAFFSDDVLEIETNSPEILRDFDTMEEYKKELNQI